MDHDSRVHLAKQYRTQWAAAPAAMISVIAGVSTNVFVRENLLYHNTNFPFLQSPLENIKTRMQS
jgi:hypothetical protein